MRRTVLLLSVAAILGGLALPATAGPIMPSFAGVPAGWVTDRYQPTVFANVGTYQGRADVLAIGITSAGSYTNRPAAYQSTFYNTQGMQYTLTGGAGSVLSADLWIPQEWSDPAANGTVRTDMWGVMTDGTTVTDYPIIGFTNYGGDPRFRVWDENLDGGAGAWVDLSTPVAYDAWTSFSIQFTGTEYVYTINGIPVYTDSTVNGSTGFSATIMQAYNFGGDPSIPGANPQDYTAHWSNTVPDGGATLTLLGCALVGLGTLRRRFRS